MAPEKRRASSRLREQPSTRLRVALSEKQNSSANEKQKDKREPAKPTTPPVSPKKAESLPTKPIDTAPLPTLRGIDLESLSNIEWQTIADRFVDALLESTSSDV
jgi:hypothetical protein